MLYLFYSIFFFFFNDTATTEIYTLSLHDALPISCASSVVGICTNGGHHAARPAVRSEEHTSELQSRSDLVCRLLLEKKKDMEVRIGSSHDPNIDLHIVVVPNPLHFALLQNSFFF